MFNELGFLSEESQRLNARSQIQDFQQFETVKALSRTALAELKDLPYGDIEAGLLLGRVFWWRCIETCQATTILADLGMSTAAMSTSRLAFESLFYACALWRNPKLYHKLKQTQENELKKFIDAVSKDTKGQISESQFTQLSAFRPDAEKQKSGLSAYDAAEISGLLDLYAVAYRGLSLFGAHSTLFSAQRGLQRSSNGDLSFILQPDFHMVGPLMDDAVHCLETGIQRLREISNGIKVERPASP